MVVYSHLAEPLGGGRILAGGRTQRIRQIGERLDCAIRPHCLYLVQVYLVDEFRQAHHPYERWFHTRIDSGVADKAKHEGVQIKLYAIIYELVDQVKEAMAGLLEPLLKDLTVGAAEVRKIFALSKGAPVAGCMVVSGRIVKGKVRVRRRKEIIYEGIAQSLRRFQDEVNEVRAGMECGIRIEGFTEFQVGDNIECYAMEKIAQKL